MSGSTSGAVDAVRLFVAVDIDAATRAQLASVRAAMEPVLRDARIPPRVAWVRPEAAHVTLRFIGEVPRQQLSAIQSALSSLVVRGFDVTWDVLGTFGGMRHPRVLWVAPRQVDEAFQALSDEVNTRLDPLLGHEADHPFAPHVTIGRIRDAGRGVDWRRGLAAVRWTPTVTSVTRITLYQSQQSSTGHTYTALSTYG